MIKEETLQKIYVFALLIWIITCIVAIFGLQGCGFKVSALDVQAGFTSYAEATNKKTLNVQSGNQSSLEQEDSNPLFETQKYKQLRNQPSLPKANE